MFEYVHKENTTNDFILACFIFSIVLFNIYVGLDKLQN